MAKTDTFDSAFVPVRVSGRDKQAGRGWSVAAGVFFALCALCVGAAAFIGGYFLTGGTVNGFGSMFQHAGAGQADARSASSPLVVSVSGFEVFDDKLLLSMSASDGSGEDFSIPYVYVALCDSQGNVLHLRDSSGLAMSVSRNVQSVDGVATVGVPCALQDGADVQKVKVDVEGARGVWLASLDSDAVAVVCESLRGR